MTVRMGNCHSYSSKMAEILFVQWPSLLDSLALSAAAKRNARTAEPWRHPRWLLLLRGWGLYGLTEYQMWVRPKFPTRAARLIPLTIALLPGVMVNSLLLLYFSVRSEGRWLQTMKQSPMNLRNRRLIKRPA